MNKNLTHISSFVLLLQLFACKASLAQSDSICDSNMLKKESFYGIFSDFKAVAVSPTQFNKFEWIATLAIGAGSAMVYVYDDKIQNFAQERRNPLSNKLADNFFNPYGDERWAVPATCGLFLFGTIFNKPREKKVAITAGKALVISAIYTYPVKKIFHRHRPNEFPYKHDVWDGPSLSHNHDSFYSGHTITAFTFATVLSSEYKKPIIIPILLYTGAGLTGLSRINHNKHWASDVLVGAALGYGIGKLVYNRDKKRRFIINPLIQDHKIGVAIRY